MYNEEVRKLLVNRIHSCIRIRIPKEDGKTDKVEDTLVKLWKYFEAFNSMPECSDRIFDANLSSFKILNEFVPFIYPDSVRWDPKDRRTEDLLVRKEVTLDKGDVNDFHNLESEFRRWFRKDFGSEFTTLDQIKVPKSFADVENVMMLNRDKSQKENGWMVKIDNAPFVPIPLDNAKVGGLFTERYFNSTALDNMKEYIMPLVF